MRNSVCARKHCKIDSRVYLWKSANLHSEITLNPFFLFRFNVITCIGIDLLYNFCELIHLATFQRCVKNKRRCVKIEMWFFYPRRVFILPSRCLMNAFGWDFAFMVSLRLRIKFVFSMLKFRNKICWQLVFIASRSIYTQHRHIFFYICNFFCNYFKYKTNQTWYE